MRKNIMFCVAVFSVLAFSSNVFAVIDDANTNEGATAGEAIEITDGTNTLTFNFSPSVNAIYNADSADDAGNKQWYSVATYHSGGQSFYASSQDSTGVYKQARGANQAFEDVTIPTSKTMTETTGTGDETVTTTYSAEEYWLGKGWSK